jgi:16S rRNA (cytosine1402-N4)-methyltransferase
LESLEQNLEYLAHYTVLKEECLEIMIEGSPTSARFADLTFGEGGHSLGLLERSPQSHVYAVDQDPEAIRNGKKTIAAKNIESSLSLLTMNYAQFPDYWESNHSGEGLDGILLDLGVSTHQILNPTRGFSFRSDAFLDMRMNNSEDNESDNAADLLATLPEEELSALFRDFGGEHFADRIAHYICVEREKEPIIKTTQLEKIIFHAYPKKMRYGKTHPATKVFQALRIAVNQEILLLQNTLPKLMNLLRPGGKILCISFHSLEDRVVKQLFKQHAMTKEFSLYVKKPILPSARELEENRRSRSAKLRVLKRVLERESKEIGESAEEREF